MTTLKKPFRLNLGFLVNSPIGSYREFDFELQNLKAAEDLILVDLSGQVRIDRTPQGLLVQADFGATVALECARCLTGFEHPLPWQFTELYAFTEDNVTDSGLLMPEDARIDLEPLVREYALLEIPISPVCKPECKGLCPVCGENLNEIDCGHRNAEDDSPFAALKDLVN